MMGMQNETSNDTMTHDEVLRFIHMSRTTLWRKRKAGNFPPPSSTTDTNAVWPRDAVEAWKRDQMERTRKRY